MRARDYGLAEHLLDEDVSDAVERTLIRVGLGYEEPLTLIRLPAVEDTDRLVREIRRVA